MSFKKQKLQEAIAGPSYERPRRGESEVVVPRRQDLTPIARMLLQSTGEALDEIFLKNPAVGDNLVRNLTEWRRPTRAVLLPRKLDTRNMQETSEEFKLMIARNIMLRYRDYLNLGPREGAPSLSAKDQLAGVTWKELVEQLRRERDARNRWYSTPIGTRPPDDTYTQFVNRLAQRLRIPLLYAISYILEYTSREAHNGIDVDIQINDVSSISYSIIRDENCILSRERIVLPQLREIQGRIMDAMRSFEERYFEALQRVRDSPCSSLCRAGYFFLSEEERFRIEQQASEQQRVEMCDGSC